MTGGKALVSCVSCRSFCKLSSLGSLRSAFRVPSLSLLSTFGTSLWVPVCPGFTASSFGSSSSATEPFGRSAIDSGTLRSCRDGLIGSNRGLILGDTLGIVLGDLEVFTTVLLLSLPIFLLNSGASCSIGVGRRAEANCWRSTGMTGGREGDFGGLPENFFSSGDVCPSSLSESLTEALRLNRMSDSSIGRGTPFDFKGEAEAVADGGLRFRDRRAATEGRRLRLGAVAVVVARDVNDELRGRGG